MEDILTELHKRDLYEAIRLIFRQLSFQNIVQMQFVSKSWLDIMEQRDVWRLILLNDYNTCAKFKKTCDVMGWTPYLKKEKTPEPGQLKYVAYVTKYVSTKQSKMMEPDFVEPSVGGWKLGKRQVNHAPHDYNEYSMFSYKLTNEWFLGVHPTSIRAYPLPDMIRTQQGVKERLKIFDVDQIGGISGGGMVCGITVDNEDKPWRNPTTLAGLQLCHVDCATCQDFPNPYVMRCTLWDFETCSILQHIPIQDPLDTCVKFCCFLDDMFFLAKAGADPSEWFFRDQRSAKPDWGRQGTKIFLSGKGKGSERGKRSGRGVKRGDRGKGSDRDDDDYCDDPDHPDDPDEICESCEDEKFAEEIVHVTGKGNTVLIVTYYQVLHYQKMPYQGLEFLKSETMYKRERFTHEGAGSHDCFSFYEHLALDYSLTFEGQYTLRDITKSRYNGGQVIWTCSDPDNTIYLSLDNNSLQMWGLAVNYNASPASPVIALHMNQKRAFVTMSLQDVVASPNFVERVQSLIEKTPMRDDPAIPPATVIGAPTVLPRRFYGTSSCMAIAKFRLDPAAYAVTKQLTAYEEIVTFIDMNSSFSRDLQPTQTQFRCRYVI